MTSVLRPAAGGKEKRKKAEEEEEGKVGGKKGKIIRKKLEKLAQKQ